MNNEKVNAKIYAKNIVKGKVNNAIIYEEPKEVEELIDEINNEEITGTTVDKLNYLNETKEEIKEAIINKNVEVEDEDTFRSYADKIDSISQSEPTLDVGGKNPVLVKEYHEEIPFSETNFPNITPTTSNQNIYTGKTVFTEPINLTDFDYVVVHFVYIEPVYTEEMPETSSYIKRTAYCTIYDFYATDKLYNSACVTFPSKTQMRYHKANNSNLLHTDAIGIRFDNPSTSLPMSKDKAKVNTNDVQIAIYANYMTADAFEKIDAEKTKIIFDIKLYQVDKGTTPVGCQRQSIINYIYGG